MLDWLTEDARTHVMGIVNVTPDSFHDGGRYDRSEVAIERALRLLDEGADILDIGGESTRPGAAEVSTEQELKRILPVIEGVRARSDALISVDTWKSEVAGKALDTGANWVNDVSGGKRDPEMLTLVAEKGVPYVLMHMRGTPETMASLTDYDDMTGEMVEYFKQQITALEAVGGRREQVIVDPGIGFAKKPADNYHLLANLDKFRELERPLLVGPSRKRFLQLAGGEDTEDRLPGSLAAVTICSLAGVEIVRVHDVKEAVQVCEVVRRVRAERTQ